MKFGIILLNYGANASADDLLETARLAEELKFDSAWTSDHILLPRSDAERFGKLFESLTTLAYLAGATKHIRFGVSSLVLPQRNPVTVAKQVAALDALSGGRAMLCVGVGWSSGEYANLGMRFDNRGARMDEAVKILKLLWGTEPGQTASFHGEHYQFEEAVFEPVPIQPGGPPLWIGGHAAPALRRAAELADGWHASSISHQVLAEGAAHIREVYPDRKVTISARLRLSFDPDDPTAHLKGSPDEIIDQFHAYRQAGLEYPAIHFRPDERPGRFDAMRRFVKDVAPAFREDVG
jgi:probable F420-dependent oxidoreductase